METLKDAIRLKKDVTLCFPKCSIRGDHVLLLTPAQINRLDKAQVEGRRVQIRLSARQVTKNVSYTGGFIMSLARALPFVARALPTVLSGLVTGLLSGGIIKVMEPVLLMGKNSTRIYKDMINAIEYRNAKAMVSI